MKRAPLWSDRWQLAVAAVTNAAGQSVVYAIGGTSATAVQSKVMAYNTVTNTWTLKAPLPRALHSTNGAAAIDGKIYVSGGFTTFRLSAYEPSQTSTLYRYDPQTNTWSQLRNMPVSGAGGVTGVINGKLYVLTTCYEDYGGYYDTCEPSRFFRYNPATDRWATLPRPHSSYENGTGGVLDGRFYVTAGSNLEMYDPATNQWTVKASPPSPTHWGAAGAVQSAKLYVFGGFAGWNPDDTRAAAGTTTIYHPATDTWTEGPSMPYPQWGIAAVSRVMYDGRPWIEIVGGAGPGNNQAFFP
jgi:N-acetylneuraminic acid mutarotase